MHRKITKTMWLVTALAMLLSAAACGAQESGGRTLPAPEAAAAETPAPEPTAHVHDWLHGVCRICGERCEHIWEDGVCTICGESCEHVWEDGVCTLCGVSCTHHWDRGVCRICGTICLHEQHDPKTGRCTVCWLPIEHDYVNAVCTRCGEGPGFIEKLLDFPEAAAAATEKKGKQETYHLPRTGGEVLPGARNLKRYEDKTMLDFVVYTPYGYDPDQQYDVVIIAPGAGHNAHYWLDRANKLSVSTGRIKGVDLLDSMIASGHVKPAIFVVTEYYLHGQPAKSSVYLEQNLREYILPFLAENYATYASLDEAGQLVPAPEHFAFIGASFGAMIGWEMLPGCTDLFSYWGLLSGVYQKREHEDMVEKINTSIGEMNPVRFLYAGDGNRAEGWLAYRNRIGALIKACGCFEEGKNILFLASQKTAHTFSTWDIGLYNCMQIFFQNKFVPGAEPVTEETEEFSRETPEASAAAKAPKS